MGASIEHSMTLLRVEPASAFADFATSSSRWPDAALCAQNQRSPTCPSLGSSADAGPTGSSRRPGRSWCRHCRRLRPAQLTLSAAPLPCGERVYGERPSGPYTAPCPPAEGSVAHRWHWWAWLDTRLLELTCRLGCCSVTVRSCSGLHRTLRSGAVPAGVRAHPLCAQSSSANLSSFAILQGPKHRWRLCAGGS